MRALIRNPGETVRETDGILGIDWTTGAPLTNAAWCGGPYTLVENYVEPAEGEAFEGAGTESPSGCNDEVVATAPSVSEEPAEDAPKEKLYVINGRTFTESEIKNLLIAE